MSTASSAEPSAVSTENIAKPLLFLLFLLL
jgi:hypothetical protein